MKIIKNIIIAVIIITKCTICYSLSPKSGLDSIIDRDFKVFRETEIDPIQCSNDAIYLFRAVYYFDQKLDFLNDEIHQPRFRWKEKIIVHDEDLSIINFIGYVIKELSRNIDDYSKGGFKLTLQIIENEKGTKGVKIISYNPERINDPGYVITGGRIRPRKDELEPVEGKFRGSGLTIIRNIAFSNKGVIFTIDTDGIKIVTSYKNVSKTVSSSTGTRIEVVILKADFIDELELFDADISI